MARNAVGHPRRDTIVAHIVIASSRGATRDRIHGLQAGADDYLPKPFQPEELVARVQSLLRRAYPVPKATHLRVGDVELDEAERSVEIRGLPIELTGAEFHLLRLLIEQPGIALPSEELIAKIFDRNALRQDRSIDTLASNLRRKLGHHPGGTDRIKSVRNVGYTYVTDRKR